jgi:uncharacterized membrane protein
MTTSALEETRSDGRQDEAATAAVPAGRAFSVLLVVCGALGLLASWVITLDKFKLLENPHFVPACSINPIISCGNIMKSAQAGVFRRWYWLGLQAGTVFGVCFVTWLQYESLYVIGSLCLWCMLAWAVTIATFWYTLVHNIKRGIIPAPAGLRNVVLEFHWAVPVLWYGAILLAIATRWWSYWSTLL